MAKPMDRAPSASHSLARRQDRDTDELIGICRGILADGAVVIEEAEYLHKWLADNHAHADQWPYNVLYPRLTEMLEDGVLDTDEEKELIDLLLATTGAPRAVETVDNEKITSMSTELPIEDPKRIDFDGRAFVATGKFFNGQRKFIYELIEARGGNTATGITGKTNYLVIGGAASRDWVHSSFGRKIEKAITLKEGGQDLTIISEERLFKTLDN